MPDSKPAILIVQPHLGVLGPLFEAEFTVWRLWAGPPLEAASGSPEFRYTVDLRLADKAKGGQG